jgi:hypothetical protein
MQVRRTLVHKLKYINTYAYSHILHEFTYTQHRGLAESTVHSDPDPGRDLGRSNIIEEQGGIGVGIAAGQVVGTGRFLQGSSDLLSSAGPDVEFYDSGVAGGWLLYRLRSGSGGALRILEYRRQCQWRWDTSEGQGSSTFSTANKYDTY